jgi:hypothetical protein
VGERGGYCERDEEGEQRSRERAWHRLASMQSSDASRLSRFLFAPPSALWITANWFRSGNPFCAQPFDRL